MFPLFSRWWYEKNGGGQCNTVEDDSMDEYCKLPPVAQKIPGDFGNRFYPPDNCQKYI